jgi:SnoaL-like domain
VELWFTAVDNRRAEVLIGMCNPDVVIRPFLARQPVDAVGYYGHDGIRQWVESLDADMRIELELISIEIIGEQSAVVEAEVWFEREGTRTGGMTFSLWRFDAGKLSEAIGYGSKEEALDAEAGGWH